MPLNTETIDFEEEREDLREQMGDVAEKQVKWSNDPEKSEALLEVGERLNSQLNILEWAEQEWGADALTLSAISEGERNYVDNFCNDEPEIARRVPLVAVGTYDAPYLEHDPDDIEDGEFEETVGRLVSEIPIPFIEWAESKIGTISYLEADEGNEYLQLVQEKRQAKNTGRDGETTAEPLPSHTGTLPTE